MIKIIITFLTMMFLNICSVHAHQDFYIIKDFGNIKVRIQTGYEYEEINKTLIIGQLAEKLTKELDYKQQVFLDFTHNYIIDNNEMLYFISFDNGTFLNNGIIINDKLFENDVLVIRQLGSSFNIQNTLKLIEYSLKNEKRIKKSQKKTIFKNPFFDLELNSVEKSSIEKIIKSKYSKEVHNLILLKTYRPDDNFKFGFTYYWQDGKYIIIKKDFDEKETILFELDSIYDFRLIGNCTFIFPTKNEFITVNYPYNRKYQKMISDLSKIEDGEKNYKPYKIELIGGNKYSIYFSFIGGGETFLIYDEAKNNIITLEE